MKKSLSIFILILSFAFVFIFSGCSSQGGGIKTYKAFTFSVNTGDKVHIKLDTTGGYNITSDLPFEISQDGSILSQGTFIKATQFENYVQAVSADSNAKIIEKSTKDSNQYVFWSYNDNEFNMVILINNSNTGILLGNPISENSAKECFERLTISLDED